MEPSKITIEDLSAVRKRLQVEVPADTVAAELERAFQAVGRQARLHGFRPGKAPRPVIERVYGEQVRRDVLGRLVGESFHQAVEEHRLAVVGTPDIDADQLKPGEALRYSAVVDVRPTVTVGNLDGLEAVRPDDAITDADVARVLEELRQSVAQLRPVTDRTRVEAGDVVTVDLATRLDGGEPVRREGVLLEAGAGSFPLALERQLVGQECGRQFSLRVPYPPDYPNNGLAGKAGDFEVTIKDLRLKELPPLDDDLARDHGRCESLAELRARVRADLEREARERADNAVREAIIDQLLARHTVEVPHSLVERRTEALLGTLNLRLPEGSERDKALTQVRAQLEPRAERQVRAELVLDAIAERDGITVSEGDLDTEVEAIARREQQVPERVRAFYQRPEARSALRANLVREHALARLTDVARITPGPGRAEEVAVDK
jgi:trigger factor